MTTNASIYTSVKEAKTPEQIIKAAHDLLDVDAPQAIEPLAHLNRIAPGWIVTLLSLASTVLVSLIGFAVAVGLIVPAIWYIFAAFSKFLLVAFPERMFLWWLGLVGLLSLWWWRDSRLRGLLDDRRFVLSANEWPQACLVVLWPCRMLAIALRMCVAFAFLILMLALPLVGLVVVVATLEYKVAHGLLDPLDPLTYGIVAGAILVLLGLFVYSDWPREAGLRRHETIRQKLTRLGSAAVIGTIPAMLVYWQSPVNRELLGLASGFGFFMLFKWFLGMKSSSQPFDLRWARRLDFHMSERQAHFLKFMLFLLSLLGAGVVIMQVVERWALLRPEIPVEWLKSMRNLFGYGLGSQSHLTLEPLLVGCFSAGILYILGLVYWTGWGTRLACPFAWPFFWLRKALENLLIRIRARIAVRHAIQRHRNRNNRLVGGRGELAVCRKDLARFESRQAHLSYLRRWRYWWCRVCKSDAHVFVGVRAIRGVFDQSMTESVLQKDDVLLVNLLPKSDGKIEMMPLDLQEVQVSYADNPYSVEEFIVAYQNLVAPVNVPKLGQMRLVIEPSANLDANIRRMLARTFRT